MHINCLRDIIADLSLKIFRHPRALFPLCCQCCLILLPYGYEHGCSSHLIDVDLTLAEPAAGDLAVFVRDHGFSHSDDPASFLASIFSHSVTRARLRASSILSRVYFHANPLAGPWAITLCAWRSNSRRRSISAAASSQSLSRST